MASLNKIVIMGPLLANPESRFSVDGMPIAKFPMGVSGGFNNEQEKIEVVCFKKLAEVCGQYLKTGSNVLVEGRIQVRSYEDPSGTRKWTTEILANNIQFVDDKQAAPAPVKQAVAAEIQAANVSEEVEELPEDDLPF